MQAVLLAMVVALCLAILAIQASLLRKIARIDREVWNLQGKLDHAGSWVFKQVEALGNVNAMLKLDVPLPATGGWAAAADFLQVLVRHAASAKPEVIVECSCGTSTIALARCAQLNGRGHVYSLEHDPKYAQITRDNLEMRGLSAYATIFDAPLVAKSYDGQSFSWYSLPAEFPKSIDMLVIDGPPAGMQSKARFPAGPELFPRVSSGGVVYLDDAGREGERACVADWRSAFPGAKVEFLELEKGCSCLRF